MYFKKPEQLQNFFDTLEEKNLFIIKNTQDIEQSLEDLKHNFEIKEKTLLEKEKILKKNIGELEKVIQVTTSFKYLISSILRGEKKIIIFLKYHFFLIYSTLATNERHRAVKACSK